MPSFLYQYGTNLQNIICKYNQFIIHMIYVIEGQGALVNPDEKHQYRNKGNHQQAYFGWKLQTINRVSGFR
jgi:hypothetical protein